MRSLKPITPEEIAYSEADGAVSINAESVATRLNDLLKMIQDMQQYAGRCDCMNCIVIGGCRP